MSWRNCKIEKHWDSVPNDRMKPKSICFQLGSFKADYECWLLFMIIIWSLIRLSFMERFFIREEKLKIEIHFGCYEPISFRISKKFLRQLARLCVSKSPFFNFDFKFDSFNVSQIASDRPVERHKSCRALNSKFMRHFSFGNAQESPNHDSMIID